MGLLLHPGDPLDYIGLDAVLRIDEIGVGKGVNDRLAEQGYKVDPFNASRRCAREINAEKYANRRAEAYDRLRTLLVAGQVALPYDPLLEEELLTCTGFINSSGKLQISPKDEIREIIARSPDRLDAVVLAVAGDEYPTFSGPSTGAVTL